MTSIKAFVDGFVNALKKMECLDKAKIINSYPFCKIPTLIKQPIVAVGFDNAMLKPDQIGSDIKSGNVSVYANVYIPADAYGKISADIFSGICTVASALNVTAISSKGIEYDKAAGVYVMKNVFTFNDEIDFGGEQGE